jgi:RimJ/RimL family protein N-acetyltransferase
MKETEHRVYLKLLSPEDVTQAYVNWMKDELVTQYLESRWRVFSLEELKDYVRHVNGSGQEYLFGIVLKENNQHIGNIKIGAINQFHRYGDIGLLIGEKTAWGKGYGREAIELATQYAFEKLNLNKLVAGIYVNNIGSHKAFMKAGYSEVGRLKKHRFSNGEYVDEILVERLKD